MIRKRPEEIWRGDEFVCCIDSGNGFTALNTGQNSSPFRLLV